MAGPTDPAPAAYPSTDVVYDEVKATTDSVLAERDALNTRASFILGSASILISAVTGVLTAVADPHSPHRDFVHWAVVVDIVLYVAVVINAGRAYGENNFKSVNVFQVPNYLGQAEDVTKRSLTATRLVNYTTNRDTLARKTRATVIALGALIAEVVWLAVILIVVAIG